MRLLATIEISKMQSEASEKQGKSTLLATSPCSHRRKITLVRIKIVLCRYCKGMSGPRTHVVQRANTLQKAPNDPTLVCLWFQVCRLRVTAVIQVAPLTPLLNTSGSLQPTCSQWETSLQALRRIDCELHPRAGTMCSSHTFKTGLRDIAGPFNSTDKNFSCPTLSNLTP